ncbi:hypothetical protein BJ165DRAFT_1592543 [Panaeolus papilionaceus]|nr:hypothetical protein BJ165DRAFT_1592543 [Panaeolus papilionaceus]
MKARPVADGDADDEMNDEMNVDENMPKVAKTYGAEDDVGQDEYWLRVLQLVYEFTQELTNDLIRVTLSRLSGYPYLEAQNVVPKKKERMREECTCWKVVRIKLLQVESDWDTIRMEEGTVRIWSKVLLKDHKRWFDHSNRKNQQSQATDHINAELQRRRQLEMQLKCGGHTLYPVQFNVANRDGQREQYGSGIKIRSECDKVRHSWVMSEGVGNEGEGGALATFWPDQHTREDPKPSTRITEQMNKNDTERRNDRNEGKGRMSEWRCTT